MLACVVTPGSILLASNYGVALHAKGGVRLDRVQVVASDERMKESVKELVLVVMVMAHH